VNERPAEALRCARDVTVLAERLQMTLDLLAQRLCGVPVVMEMELDLAEAAAHERCEVIEELGPVLLARKEPAVARRAPVAVAERAERWIALTPRLHARVTHVVGGLAPQRLVVVAKREENVPWTAPLWRARTANHVPEVVWEPRV
jgi:hypothetical protein